LDGYHTVRKPLTLACRMAWIAEGGDCEKKILNVDADPDHPKCS